MKKVDINSLKYILSNYTINIYFSNEKIAEYIYKRNKYFSTSIILLLILWIVIILGNINIIFVEDINLITMFTLAVTISSILSYMFYRLMRHNYNKNDFLNTFNYYDVKRHLLLRKISKLKDTSDFNLVSIKNDNYITESGKEIPVNNLLDFFEIDDVKYSYSNDIDAIYFSIMELNKVDPIESKLKSIFSILKSYYYIHLRTFIIMINILALIYILFSIIK